MADHDRYLDRRRHTGKMTIFNHLGGKSAVPIRSDGRLGADLERRDPTNTGWRRAR